MMWLVVAAVGMVALLVGVQFGVAVTRGDNEGTLVQLDACQAELDAARAELAEAQIEIDRLTEERDFARWQADAR